MSDLEFMGGFFAEKPRDGRPDWVKATIDVDLDSAIAFLEKKKLDGEQKIKFEVRESKGGKFCAAIDLWKPNSGVDTAPTPSIVSAAKDSVGGAVPF